MKQIVRVVKELPDNNKVCVTMDDELMEKFIRETMRFECWEHPFHYGKGIRSTLIALGYDEDWVSNEFKMKLDEIYGESGCWDFELRRLTEIHENL